MITYHTTNHATDTQQVLSTKQPALIMLQSDANQLPTMPQCIVPTSTINPNNERYDWRTVEIGCGLDQKYPNSNYKRPS